jgi:hypothetical protein
MLSACRLNGKASLESNDRTRIIADGHLKAKASLNRLAFLLPSRGQMLQISPISPNEHKLTSSPQKIMAIIAFSPTVRRVLSRSTKGCTDGPLSGMMDVIAMKPSSPFCRPRPPQNTPFFWSLPLPKNSLTPYHPLRGKTGLGSSKRAWGGGRGRQGERGEEGKENEQIMNNIKVGNILL